MCRASDFAVAPECLFRFIYMPLRIHWRLLTFLKISNKSVWGNVLHVKVYIFWKFIQYIIHWDKNQMLKKCLSSKINVTKNALFFLSRAPTHHSFIFNSQFLFKLKHMVHLSKTVCGIFHFWFRLVFVKLFFCSTKSMDSLTLKHHNSLQKPYAVLLPDLWIFKLQQDVWKFNDICDNFLNV